MKFLLSLISIFLLAISFAQPNKVDSQGRKQGEWGKTYPDSKVYMYKGQFKNDKPVGDFTYFYESSKVKAIIKHGATGARSEAYFYHENGVLMSFGIYRNYKKDSVWTNFGPSGRVSNRTEYKDDKIHGKRIIYFVPEDPNDKSVLISESYTYVNGVLDGEFNSYFLNTRVKEKGNYKNNLKEGIWEEFYPNGKRRVLYRYKQGKKHGWIIVYDDSGKRIKENYYYYGNRLEGEELEQKLKQMEEKGIDPNG